MAEIPAEQSANTPPSVREGLGYPNDRKEVSPTPTGWQGLDTEGFSNVSRETSGDS